MTPRRVANGDIAVVIPGILGSRLQRDGEDIWGYRAIIRRLPHLVDRLTDDLALVDVEDWSDPMAGATDRTVATGLLRTFQLIPGFWGVQGYDQLVRYLLTHFDRRDIEVFPYDWRLSNRVSAQRLQSQIEPLITARRLTNPDARLILIGHSMGGLVARYYAEVLDRGVANDAARNTRRVVTIGTPFRGATKALEVMANGRMHIGPFSVDLGPLIRSLPSVSELLPTYEVLGPTVGELSRLGRRPGVVQREELTVISDPTIVTGLPRAAWSNCVRFHDEIDRSAAERADEPVDYRATLEYVQPTAVWASIEMGGVRTHSPDDYEERGDGTVPRWSATPPTASASSVTYLSGRHAALQQTRGVYHQIRGILSERVGQPPPLPSPIAADDQIAVEAPDLSPIGEPMEFLVDSFEGLDDLRLGVSIDQGPLVPMTFDQNTGRYRAITPPITEPGVRGWVVDSLPDSPATVEAVSDLVYVAQL